MEIAIPALLLAICFALVAVAVALRPRRQPPASPPAPDLLAEAEEAEFVPRAPHAPTPENLSDEVEWEENEDVYRPRAGEAAAFVAELRSDATIEVARGMVTVCIRSSAMDCMQAHLAGDTSVELGGLLVGRVCFDRDLDAHVTVVERALPASEGAGTATTFTYTTESWSHLAPDLRDLPADMTVVGSYHSHPNMGVFLSSTDLNTQAEVFPQPWQIAVVMDPVQDEMGVFTGQYGKPRERWYLVED